MDVISGIIMISAIAAFFIIPFLFFKDAKKGYIAAGVLFVSSLAAAFADPGIFFVTAVPVTIGTVSGFVFDKKKSFQFYILISSLILFAVFTLQYHYLVDVEGMDIFAPYQNLKDSSFTAGMDPEERLEMTRSLDLYLGIFKYNTYFFLFVQSVFWSIAGYMVLRLAFIKEIIRKKIKFKGIEFFKLNEYFVFVLIAFLAAVALFNKQSGGELYRLAVNGLLISAFLYLIQAIGILRFLLVKFKLPRLLLPLTIMLVLLAGHEILFVTAAVAAAFGLLDIWADFRKFDSAETVEKK